MISYELNKKDVGKRTGTKDQLLFDKAILHDCRKRHTTNQGMA